TAEERLMEIVAQRKAVGESLQVWHLPLSHVEEAHRVAQSVGLVRRELREREQVVETAGGVILGGVLHAAILLLSSLEEAMGHVAGVVMVADIRPLEGERSRKRAGAGDAGVEHAVGQVAPALAQQTKLTGLDIRIFRGNQLRLEGPIRVLVRSFKRSGVAH